MPPPAPARGPSVLLPRLLLALAIGLFAFALQRVRRAVSAAGDAAQPPPLPASAAAAAAAALACTLLGAMAGWGASLTPLHSLPAAASEDAFHRLFAARQGFESVAPPRVAAPKQAPAAVADE
jgi:hypothetical protein